jgi:thioredoxin reductase (NADPH)
MSKYERTDVLIIGAGPAGLSAATWCSDLGLSAVLIEREPDIGGQLNSIYGPIENYMGVRAQNGREMLSHFRETVGRFCFLQLVKTEVTGIDLSSMCVRLGNGEGIDFRSLIIATGVRRRRLGIPGEMEFRGKGVIESGVRERSRVAGKDVVIVGGGDAALENALILSESAGSVKVVHRRSDLTARAEFLSKIEARDNIELLLETAVTRIVGDSNVSAVELESMSTGRTWTLHADVVLIRIGVEPNAELMRGIVELDDLGYIKVNALCETSVAGVFAVGDVANPISPTLSTAVGTGATASRLLHRFIKARRDAV